MSESNRAFVGAINNTADLVRDLQIEPEDVLVAAYSHRVADDVQPRPKAFAGDGVRRSVFPVRTIVQNQGSNASALAPGSDDVVAALARGFTPLVAKANAKAPTTWRDETSMMEVIETLSAAAERQLVEVMHRLGLQMPSADGVEADEIWIRGAIKILDKDNVHGMTARPSVCESYQNKL